MTITVVRGGAGALPPMAEIVMGVDGGNSKTDLVLADTHGRVLSWVRGGGTRPHTDGIATTAGQLADLARDALAAAGLPAGTPVALGAFFVANIDRPEQERAAEAHLAALGVARAVVVRNDTLAALHSGAPDGWGVAVVSGAGINAAGVHPDGRTARFLSLGDITGDWGGGLGVGRAALGAAVRAGDGRGPATALRDVLAGPFGLRGAEDLALAVAAGEVPLVDLHRLAPVVFAAADDGDGVARGIVLRLGDEITAMAAALLGRLGLLETETPVVLGGGTVQNGHLLLADRVRARLAARAPLARPRVLDVPPVAGAVTDALTRAGAAPDARRRARDAVAASARPPARPSGAAAPAGPAGSSTPAAPPRRPPGPAPRAGERTG